VSDDLSIPNPGYRGNRTTRYGAAARRRPGMDPDTRRLAMFAGGIGGVLALLIVASMVTSRHNGGAIPVISPDPSPIRVRPDNPGGMKIDTAVNDAFLGGADTKNAHLGPSAEMPDSNTPHTAARTAPADATAAPGVAASPSLPTPPAVEPAAKAPAPPAKSLLAAAEPAATKPPAPKPLTVDAAPVKPAPTPAAASAKSLLAAASSPTKPPPPKPVAEADSRPAGASHPVMVQLSAMPTDVGARDEWTRLTKRYPDLFNGKDLTISRTERDNHVFWRVRTGGFADIAQARAFCDALRAKGPGCSIVDF
jgi:hypothetical protein